MADMPDMPVGESTFLTMGMILDSPMLIDMVRWYKEDRRDMREFRKGVEEEGVKIPPDVTDDMLACVQVCVRLMSRFGFVPSPVATAYLIDWLHAQERGYFMEQVEKLIGTCVAELENTDISLETRIERINLALEEAGYKVKVEASEDRPGAYRIVMMEG